MTEVDELAIPGVEEKEPVLDHAPVEGTIGSEEEYVNHNKRKFEDDGEEEEEDAHIRKRGSAPTLDGESAPVRVFHSQEGVFCVKTPSVSVQLVSGLRGLGLAECLLGRPFPDPI
jgi:hypothetical protein